ncbi:hypothetical protein BESB_024880 [Besnoitia besnoiti]|uniref:UTP23 sensor motif region domain-containing protein n=1 Tax=Besnoitia besnoiti TaxID=94643 RepID=A0A2A9M809_BESBE|nr:uncharacterized protein BESB_024880 [Besnoitia besnoiti]PFH31522.1 hypothetical protein BESB_024880 [Besnoitia besnoiti]
MRISRRKQFKRVMRFYSVGFGIREPFKVLVDGTFLTAALKHRISLADKLPLLLGGQCSTMVTPCIVSELRQLPREKSAGAIAACKRFRRFKCGHELDDARSHLVTLPENADPTESQEEEKEPSGENEAAWAHAAPDAEAGAAPREKFSLHPALSAFRARQEEERLGTGFAKKRRHAPAGGPAAASAAAEAESVERDEATSGSVFCADAFRCVCRVIGHKNPSKLCVATQDKRLRERLRQIPGVPLIFIYKGGILQLEPPTSKTRETHKQEEKKKLKMGKAERRLFHETRRKVKAQNALAGGAKPGAPGGMAAVSTEKKKKQGRKGVNPLSCKKAQKTVTVPPKTATKKRTRSRRKKSAASGAERSAASS